MAKFKSVPHDIDAFQFQTSTKNKAPDWFVEAYHKGEVQITMSDKYGYYVVVYGEGQIEKAMIGDWVCFMRYKDGRAGGKIYVLSDAKFRESYKV